MITRLLTLLLAACTLCLGQPVRIVTWNLQWFPGKSPTSKPDAAAAHIAEVRKALAEIQPDILVLQEVSGEAPVAEAISILPDYKVAVISRFKNAAGLLDGQQIAICSRFAATRVFSSRWDKGWAGAPRGFAYAAFDCDGTVVNVYGLHLKSNIGDPEGNTAKREDAIEQLIKHQQEMQAQDLSANRWIVCGDFNTCETNISVPAANVLSAPYVILDFDSFDGRKPTTPTEIQEHLAASRALIRWIRDGLGWNLAAILATGSVGLHAWFHTPPQDVLDSLKAAAKEFGLDAGLLGHPEHPCRLPGHKHDKTGVPSEILWLQESNPFPSKELRLPR